MWNFRYNIARLDTASQATPTPMPPIRLTGDDMLGLEEQPGNGFVYDCFEGADPEGDGARSCDTGTGNCVENSGATTKPDACASAQDICDGNAQCRAGCPGPACVPDTTTAPATVAPSGKKRLFMLAGQSNAEGNVNTAGLKALAEAFADIPQSGAIGDDVRATLMAAVRVGRGNMCNSGVDDDATASNLVSKLQQSSLDWASFAAPGFVDARVEIRAANFRHSKVTLTDKSGNVVDNGKCDANANTADKVGPPLSRYTSQGTQDLGVGWGTDTTTGYGPELAFGVKMADALAGGGDTVGIVKVAMGGSSLGDHWRVGGTLYNQLVRDTKAALQDAPTDLSGLVWFQGYNDQYNDVFCQDLKPHYGHNLVAFINQLRADLGVTFPVVVVKANHGVKDAIHTAQEEAVAALMNAKSSESKDMSNCFHYDSGSMVVIGEGAADAMIALLNKGGPGGETTRPLPSTTTPTTTTRGALYGLMNPTVRCGDTLADGTTTTHITTSSNCKDAAAVLGLGFARAVDSDDRPAGCWKDPNKSVYFNANMGPSNPWEAPRSICAWVQLATTKQACRVCPFAVPTCDKGCAQCTITPVTCDTCSFATCTKACAAACPKRQLRGRRSVPIN